MKKSGILNAHLSAVVASTGHTDKLCVCDSGYPYPHGKEVVDLALTSNIPRFTVTLKVILEELKIEGAIVANEMETRSPHMFKAVKELLPDIKIETIPHEEFKQLTRNSDNITFVKTGEATPFCNIILFAGVVF